VFEARLNVCPTLACPALSYPLLSSPILSYPVQLYRVIFCDVTRGPASAANRREFHLTRLLSQQSSHLPNTRLARYPLLNLRADSSGTGRSGCYLAHRLKSAKYSIPPVVRSTSYLSQSRFSKSKQSLSHQLGVGEDSSDPTRCSHDSEPQLVQPSILFGSIS
jgi:hypothetical protein